MIVIDNNSSFDLLNVFVYTYIIVHITDCLLSSLITLKINLFFNCSGSVPKGPD